MGLKTIFHNFVTKLPQAIRGKHDTFEVIEVFNFSSL